MLYYRIRLVLKQLINGFIITKSHNNDSHNVTTMKIMKYFEVIRFC